MKIKNTKNVTIVKMQDTAGHPGAAGAGGDADAPPLVYHRQDPRQERRPRGGRPHVNPEPDTLDPEPETTMNPEPDTLNPEPETWSMASGTRNPDLV